MKLPDTGFSDVHEQINMVTWSNLPVSMKSKLLKRAIVIMSDKII